MIITIPFIQEKFNTFNKLIFGGQLPEIPIYLTNARTFAGKCTFQGKRNALGKMKFFNFALRFSTRIDMTERDWEDTIIHEMIHYYIGFKGVMDSSAHGETFCKLMEEINRKHHRNISISHRKSTPGTSIVPEKRPRYRFVARLELSNGKWAVKVLPKVQQRILTFYKSVQSSPSVKQVDFFWSKDSLFSVYPCSSSLRVQMVEKGELERHLKDALPVDIEEVRNLDKE